MLAAEDLVDYVHSAKEDALDSLERILLGAGDPVKPEACPLRGGDAGDVLPQLVEREKFDLIAMGSPRARGNRRVPDRRDS